MTTLVSVAISSALGLGLTYLAAALRKKQPNRNLLDDRQPTLASRGSVLPIVLGTRRVAPLFAWAGGRVAAEKSGGKGGGGAVTGYKYYEFGVHWICIGPATALNKIWSNGKNILANRITSQDTPSGTSVDTIDNDGLFVIYWGTADQPVNTELGKPERMGVSSRWPNVCYVEWRPKTLGAAPQWSNLEYEIEVKVAEAPLLGSTAWMNATGVVTDSGLATSDDGVNAAHALWQLLTGSHPHGIGIPTDQLDAGAFETLGGIIAAEHLPINILADNGVDAAQKILEFMEDLGFVLTEVSTGAGLPMRLAPYAVRAPITTVPALTTDHYAGGEPEQAKQHGRDKPDRIVFSIRNRARGYAEDPVNLSLDGSIRFNRKPQIKRVAIPSVVDLRTAAKVAAARQMQLLTAGNAYTFQGLRGVRTIEPGQPFTFPGIGRLRVASKSLDVDSGTASVSALQDHFGVTIEEFIPDDVDEGGGGPSNFPLPDLYVFADELPAALSATPAIGVARVRGSQAVIGADVWFSGDGVTYAKVGSQNSYAAGGTLNSSIAIDAPAEISLGPTITAFNDDIAEVLDLSGDELSWRNGTQIAVIGSEWFFLRNITAVGGGGWRLEGLIRARYDTVAQAHAQNSNVVIFQRNKQKPFASALIVSGATVWVKTQPFTSSGSVDLATVTPVQVVIP